MRLLTLALALLAPALTAFAASPDNSKSSGATVYEGIAQLIADGPNTEDHKLWAKQAARAADGENWLENSAQTLISAWMQKALNPEVAARWKKPETFILLSALLRQSAALDMSGRYLTATPIVRNGLAATIKLDPNAPTLVRLAWQIEDAKWNRSSIDPRSDKAFGLFMQELTKAVEGRAKLTPRQWGQLADFIPLADKRARILKTRAPAKEYQPLLDALLKAEDFRPTAMRHVLLSVSYYHKAWIERGFQYNQNTSEEEKAAFGRNIALAYQELLLARKTAAADDCNLTPLFRVVTYTGAGLPLVNTSGGRAQTDATAFVDECLQLARSDRERTEVVDTYKDYSEDGRIILSAKMRELIAAAGAESGIAIESLRYRAQLAPVMRRVDESAEDWHRRSIAAAQAELPKYIELATEIQKAANQRRERVAYNGQFIDPKALTLAAIPRYFELHSPMGLSTLRKALAMPDSRYGAPTEDDVDVNARHVFTYAPTEYPYRDRTGVMLLMERPELEREWWGWPTSSENKPSYEASFIESWSQAGKLDEVFAAIKRVEQSSPPLSSLSRERLMTLKRVAEVMREYQTQGVLHLAWNDPVWRDKSTHYHISRANPERKLNLGSRRNTISESTTYSDFQMFELRAPIPQPYAIEFEFEHAMEVLPQKYPFPRFISSVGFWTQDPDDNPQSMFTGIRTSEQANGVYFSPDPKARSAKPNFFPFPATHPKANGKAKGGKARAEVRDGQVVWFLDGIPLFDSKKAGLPPIPQGLLRIGILSSVDFPGTATFGPVTITRLK